MQPPLAAILALVSLLSDKSKVSSPPVFFLTSPLFADSMSGNFTVLKISLSLCNTMPYRIYDVLEFDSMSGNFTYCIPNTRHNLNEINVLHFGMAFAFTLGGGFTFEPRQPKKENMS